MNVPTPSLPLAALKALRPKQWVKNSLLFAALVFSMNFSDPALLLRACLGFFAFCMVSSSGYLYNDARDREADQRHPRKRYRPIASGALPLRAAYVEMVIIFGIGMGVAWFLSPAFAAVTGLYLATTLSYSIYFKHVPILDVMFIAACFVWRAAAGAVVVEVDISPWLLTCTSFLALFVGFNKRLGELKLMADDAAGTRKSLKHYSQDLLRDYQAITTSGTIISYAIYTVQFPRTQWMLLTLPHVLFGVFRYMYLVKMKGEGGAPDETFYRDKPLLITCVSYGALVVAILLFAPLRAA